MMRAGLWWEDRLMRVLFLATDVLVFAFCLHVASWTVAAFIERETFPALIRDRLLSIGVFSVACIAAGCYRPERLTDRFDSVYYTVLALLGALIGEFLLLQFLLRDSHVLSRRELVVAAGMALVLLAVWRVFAASFLVRHFRPLHRVYFVIGSAGEARRIAAAINGSGLPHARARLIALEGLRKRHEARLARKKRVRSALAEDAIIVHTGPRHGTLTEMIEMCDVCFARTFLYPSQHDAIIFQHHRLSSVAGIPLIVVASSSRSGAYPFVKRFGDIVCAAAALSVGSPLILAISIGIKLSSPGPVLFRQKRLGRDGRMFQILKFRSMVAQAAVGDGHVRAKREDPRVTSFGRFLRKYKLDEIPQFWNVLWGDMSLVGPRPLWPRFFDKDPGAAMWRERLAVRPGLTSLSHVLSSSHFEPADILRYDLMYIKNLSPLTDLRVLAATVRIVLGGKGGQ